MNSNSSKKPAAAFHTSRRSFLKQGVVAGTGVLFASALSAPARAAEGGDMGTAPNDTLRTIGSLRSIHGNFTERVIPDDAIEAILQASLRTANASNMQSYSIVVVKDRALIKKVCQYPGACLFLYCADYNRNVATAEALGHSYHPDNVTNFITATVSASLAAQTAVIAGRSLGVDSLLTNGIHRGDMERLWRLLDLPVTGCFPVIALVLGYPSREPAVRKGRLDGPGVVHREKYHRPTKEELDEIIRRYDDPAAHLGLNDDWREKHPHYLDWVHSTWLAGANEPTKEPTQMLQLLKRARFIEA